MCSDVKREQREAEEAGRRALESLYAAREKLNGAKNWGIFDMMGGGFLADLMKRSKLQGAEMLMEKAKRDV